MARKWPVAASIRYREKAIRSANSTIGRDGSLRKTISRRYWRSRLSVAPARAFRLGRQDQLMVDDYSGYKAMFATGIPELACLAHVRRKFFERLDDDALGRPVAISGRDRASCARIRGRLTSAGLRVKHRSGSRSAAPATRWPARFPLNLQAAMPSQCSVRAQKS
jgi:hypothetical protein